MAVPSVEFGVVGLLQPGFLLRDVAQESPGAGALLAVVEDGDGFAERFDVPAGLGRELLAQLPVGADACVHVFHGGVVVVPGEALRGGLFLDPLENVGLVFGPVGVDGLVIFRPEFGERVPAVVLGAGGREEVHKGYQR